MKLMVVNDPVKNVVLSGDLVTANVPLMDIQWDRELAVVVDMGERRTGGYGLTVTDVRMAGEAELRIELQVRRPGPGSFVAQVLTHPYAVAKVPRKNLAAGPLTVVAVDQNGAELARQVVEL